MNPDNSTDPKRISKDIFREYFTNTDKLEASILKLYVIKIRQENIPDQNNKKNLR
jgi:hypothetical protein